MFCFEKDPNTAFSYNPVNDFTSTIPRHTEINAFLARKICKDLGIQMPKQR